MPRWAIIAGAIVIGWIIAAVTPGVLGHVFALIVWVGAAWACLRPARSSIASRARTWARVGIAVFGCLALYAGSLAIVSAVNSGPAYGCWTGSEDGMVVVSSTAGSPLCVGGGRLALHPEDGGTYTEVGPTYVPHGNQVCTFPNGGWTVWTGPNDADPTEAENLCQWLQLEQQNNG